jgi:hypothetical protein
MNASALDFLAMKAIHITLVLTAICCLTSCSSNEELQERLDKRNETYSNFQDRREMRADARQQRTDAWFDRAMH